MSGIPDIGDIATGLWGKLRVVGRVVGKNLGTQVSLFSDTAGASQIVTITDAKFVKADEPAWSKEIHSQRMQAEALHDEWRSGIEARRIAALSAAERITAARARRSRRTIGRERELGES